MNDKIKIIFREETDQIKAQEVIRFEYGGVELKLNKETGVLQLLSKKGKVLSEVDFPTERIIKNVYYDEETQNFVFEFDNFPSINVPFKNIELRYNYNIDLKETSWMRIAKVKDISKIASGIFTFNSYGVKEDGSKDTLNAVTFSINSGINRTKNVFGDILPLSVSPTLSGSSSSDGSVDNPSSASVIDEQTPAVANEEEIAVASSGGDFSGSGGSGSGSNSFGLTTATIEEYENNIYVCGLVSFPNIEYYTSFEVEILIENNYNYEALEKLEKVDFSIIDSKGIISVLEGTELKDYTHYEFILRGDLQTFLENSKNDLPFQIDLVFDSGEVEKYFIYNQWGVEYKLIRDESLDTIVNGVQLYGYKSDKSIEGTDRTTLYVKDEFVKRSSILYSDDGTEFNYGGLINSVHGFDEKYTLIETKTTFELPSFLYTQWGVDYKFTRDESLDIIINEEQYYAYMAATTPSAWFNGVCLVKDEFISETTQLYAQNGNIIAYGGSILSVDNGGKKYILEVNGVVYNVYFIGQGLLPQAHQVRDGNDLFFNNISIMDSYSEYNLIDAIKTDIQHGVFSTTQNNFQTHYIIPQKIKIKIVNDDGLADGIIKLNGETKNFDEYFEINLEEDVLEFETEELYEPFTIGMYLSLEGIKYEINIDYKSENSQIIKEYLIAENNPYDIQFFYQELVKHNIIDKYDMESIYQRLEKVEKRSTEAYYNGLYLEGENEHIKELLKDQKIVYYSNNSNFRDEPYKRVIGFLCDYYENFYGGLQTKILCFRDYSGYNDYKFYLITFGISIPEEYKLRINSGLRIVDLNGKGTNYRLINSIDFGEYDDSYSLMSSITEDMFEITYPEGSGGGSVDETNLMYWENTLPELYFSKNSPKTEKAVFPFLKEISSLSETKSPFYNSMVSEVTFNALKTVGKYAFANSSRIKSINLNYGVTSIEDYAFKGCSSLTEIFIPNSVKKIGNYGFASSYMTKLELPEGVEKLGKYVFTSSKIETLILPTTVTEINSYSFISTNISKVYFNGTVSDWAKIRFLGDNSKPFLSSIYIKDINGNIEFEGYNYIPYNDIKEAIFEEGLTYIGEKTFNSSKLEEITLPSTLKNINAGAFAWCSNLKSVKLPENLRRIESSAFYECSSLSNISIPNKIEYIGSMAFTNISNSAYTFEKDSYYLGNIENPKLFLGSVLSSVSSYEISPEVRFIGSYAFKNCSSLPTVIIPETIKELTSLTFSECKGLINMEIPSHIKEIPYGLVERCGNLTTLKLNEGLEKIGSYAFYDTKIVSLIIPDSVIEIGSYACSIYYLKNIIIGKGIISLPNGIFNNVNATSDEPLNIYLRAEGFVALENTWAFANTSKKNTKIHVRPEYAEQYATATNWSSLIAEGLQIIGDYEDE